MGIYDQFLQLTQHGLDQGTQMAQQRAAMPSMADVFMDRFRQGGQDRMAQQKMASDLALNQAYKGAQMQQMHDNAMNQSRQRDIELQKYVSENLVGDNRPEILATVLAHGGSEAMVPKLKYEDYQYEAPTEAALSGDSLAGGIPDSKMETGQAPIAYSDWGTQAMFKDKALSLKEKLASMSEETRRYLGSVKASDAKSAVGKIMQDLASQRISPALANDAIKKATIFFDPARAALIGQGLNPAGSGLPIQTFGQTPGATQLPQQAQAIPQDQVPQPDNGIVWHDIPGQPQMPAQQAQIAPRRVASKPVAQPAGQPKVVPGPVPFAGGKEAVKSQQEAELYKSFDSKMDAMDKYIQNDILGNPAIDSALSVPGLLKGRIPKTPEYGVFQNIGVLKNQIMLNAMEALKQASPNGATGFGQLSEREGDTLRNSIASINENMSAADFKAAMSKVRSEIQRLRSLAAEKMNAMGAARNTGGQSGFQKQNFDGEVSPTGKFVFRTGKGWVPRGE